MIFDAAYRTFRARVVRWARLFGANGDAEDVAQDVFRAFEKDGAHIPDDAVAAWLRTVTRREARRMRERLRRLRLEGDTDGECTEPSPEQLLSRREIEELLLGLVARLVHQRREVFLRYVVGEQSAPKIAEALNLPLTTVQARLEDARQDLRDAIKVARAKERRKAGTASFAVAPLLLLSDLWKRRPIRAFAFVTGGMGVFALVGALADGPQLSPTPEEPPPHAAIEVALSWPVAFIHVPHEREAGEVARSGVPRAAPSARSGSTGSTASSARSAGEVPEVTLVALARRALNEGSPSRARGYLDRADSAYPDGTLLQSRAILRGRASR